MSALLVLIASSFPTLLSPEPDPLFTTLAPIADGPQLEYTFIEANYIWTDPDGIDEELGGGEIIGSLELPMNFFAQVTAAHQSDEIDLTTYRIGAGWHFGMIPRLDAYGILSYLHTETDTDSGDSKDDGIQGEIGLRFLLTDRIELNGRGIWVDIDDEDDVGFGFGARFYLIDRLSLGARVDMIDDSETYAAGLRFDF